jgi:hypothetical protein
MSPVMKDEAMYPDVVMMDALIEERRRECEGIERQGYMKAEIQSQSSALERFLWFFTPYPAILRPFASRHRLTPPGKESSP